MIQEDQSKIIQLMDYFVNEQLAQMILSNPVDKDKISKIKIRPIKIKGQVIYQSEEFMGKQAFHKNLLKEDVTGYVLGQLDGMLRQMEVLSALGNATVLVGKKGTVTVKMKKASPAKMIGSQEVPCHNRQKKYILEEGKPVPFLEDLGVMTADGRVVRTKYDKFKQINRFLEFIEDILPKLDQTRETTIVDFGCGKSYLTFAMYYYLHILKEYPVCIIGLDLKEDVILRCNQLSKRYGFDGLCFYHGDIASYDGVERVDMVVTLHACDTATDYALAKAVGWGAKVILSVPCCQHQLNAQMKNELLAPVLQYGLIRERMAALYTDALRAEILEYQGYRTQILEFVDMEHTPKNLLIRAVRQGERKENRGEIQRILDFLEVKPALAELLFSDPAQV